MRTALISFCVSFYDDIFQFAKSEELFYRRFFHGWFLWNSVLLV